MGWKVIVSPSANSDLENIVLYIARHNPDAAARVGYALVARAELLTQFPEMGRAVPEFVQPDLGNSFIAPAGSSTALNRMIN